MMSTRERVLDLLRGARTRMVSVWSKYRRRIALWFALLLVSVIVFVLVLALLAWVLLGIMNWKLIF
jgi:hypothetical protein